MRVCVHQAGALSLLLAIGRMQDRRRVEYVCVLGVLGAARGSGTTVGRCSVRECGRCTEVKINSSTARACATETNINCRYNLLKRVIEVVQEAGLRARTGPGKLRHSHVTPW
mgnify:CR=1 FL=1